MLVKLVELVDIRRGFTTGANDFFSLEPLGRGLRQSVCASEYRCLCKIQKSAKLRVIRVLFSNPGPATDLPGRGDSGPAFETTIS